MLANSNERPAIPYSEIAAIAFTGRDTAAGKSYEAWVKKYWEKRAAGEKNISIEPGSAGVIDAADAARMLRMLSGGTHKVITGVCLVVSGQLSVSSETTSVTMSDISDKDIADYVATGEPMDKAGAYAIQGIASRWISRIEGDYSNVVGLPVARVWRMLRDQRVI
jgi:hypothetical protein